LTVPLAVLLIGCAASRPPAVVFQNLVVWNDADKPTRLSIRVDGEDVYSGILGTIDRYPKIVMTRQLAYSPGRHVLFAELPDMAVRRSAVFDVADRPVNLHVAIGTEGLRVDVSYGPEAYL
jgi:hypothetical protein